MLELGGLDRPCARLDTSRNELLTDGKHKKDNATIERISTLETALLCYNRERILEWGRLDGACMRLDTNGKELLDDGTRKRGVIVC